MTDIWIRPCTGEDLAVLRDFSRRTYFETFSEQNTPENMAAYLDEAFKTEKLRRELEDTNSEFYFLYCGETLAGYLKLNEAPAQTDLHAPDSLEIERIYVGKEFQGMGLGRSLMEHAISTAVQRGKAFAWLGVWEKNTKALAFYRKNGFYPIGTHTFVMGDDPQTDYIMRKDLKR